MRLTEAVLAFSEKLFSLRYLLIIYAMWESVTFAAVLIILRGMQSGPVALFGLNDLITLFLSSAENRPQENQKRFFP